MQFQVWFGINLHKLEFFKELKCKLIPNWMRKTIRLFINNITNVKIRMEKVLEDLSWSHLFSFTKTFCQSFCTKFPSSFYVVSLASKISFNIKFLSANHNPELWCVICTHLVFALVLHLHVNCTAISQSESSNFLMYIYY